MKRSLFFIFAILLFSGCTTLRHAVPVELQEKAEIIGMANIRVFSDAPSERIIEDIIFSIGQESVNDFAIAKNGIK